MRRAIIAVGLAALWAMPAAAHENHGQGDETAERPASIGANELLREPLTLAPGIEVIMQDVTLAPNSTIPPHYHPGQEFLYLMEGAVTHYEDGLEPIEMHAGDSHVIAERAVHAPVVGPEGGRAIIVRIHVEGEPERYPSDRAPNE